MELVLIARDEAGTVLAERSVLYRDCQPTASVSAALEDVVEAGLRQECEDCGNTGLTEMQIAVDDSVERPCHCRHRRLPANASRYDAA